MKFNNYKFRCHYQGSLISVPKPLTEKQIETLEAYRLRQSGEGKPLTSNQLKTWHSLEYKINESERYNLTNTAKKICTEIVFNEKYNRKFKLENKYFDKGLTNEKQSRDLLSEVLGELLTSDNERKTNEWVTGQRDIKHDELIIDIKSTWSFDTFNAHLLENKNEYYFRQLDSYMDLWNIKDSILAYVLTNTPINLINDHLRKLNYSKNILDLGGNVYEEKIPLVVKEVQNHIFTYKGLEKFCNQSSIVEINWFKDFKEIPKKERVHLVSHSFDKTRIEQRNECLTLCREFMNEIKPLNRFTLK